MGFCLQNHIVPPTQKQQIPELTLVSSHLRDWNASQAQAEQLWVGAHYRWSRACIEWMVATPQDGNIPPINTGMIPTAVVIFMDGPRHY